MSHPVVEQRSTPSPGPDAPAGEEVVLECRTKEVWDAIKRLAVRGAPAIGVAAAYGVVLGVMQEEGRRRPDAALVKEVCDYLATSRPTAVNLFWALNRMRAVSAPRGDWKAALLAEARSIEAEDQEVCRRIGQHGAKLLSSGDVVLTHCNAGALATAGMGTALAVVYAAVAEGKQITVYADETRPLLQGSRLTAWELSRSGVPVTVICDNVAASVMRDKGVSLVITGADRIAANGDAANKIGTYGLAILAREHGIPFYVAAPTSTLDLSLAHGGLIPIEEREALEVSHGLGRRTAPPGVAIYNPAFDVTPARYITGIITEHGIAAPPYEVSLRRLAQTMC
ncbi:S-methyl-5-thioribose-1-phosphate isomerase [bacterium]|nr:S-methyl-5-thioribose-1-phosphate isomerase [bacterium]